MRRGEEFEELRPLLSAIAYRILGSVAEADDAVQETWLRYESSPTQPTSTKAFLCMDAEDGGRAGRGVEDHPDQVLAAADADRDGST